MNFSLNCLDQLVGLAFIRLSNSFPSQLAYWLFENHWLYWAGLILIAAAVSWRGMILHMAKVRNIGLGILLITVVWILGAWLVVTPRERLVQANEAIVAAAARNNVPGIMRYIAPNAMFGNLNAIAIRQLLAERLRQADISSNDIRRLDIRLDGRYATSWLNVLSFFHAYGGPVITCWRLSWCDHPYPGNWQITHIRLLKMNNHSLSNHSLPPGNYKG